MGRGMAIIISRKSGADGKLLRHSTAALRSARSVAVLSVLSPFLRAVRLAFERPHDAFPRLNVAMG